MSNLRVIKIEEICREYGIENYTINSDESVDVQGAVHLKKYKITKLPLEFGKISGDFECVGFGFNNAGGLS